LKKLKNQWMGDAVNWGKSLEGPEYLGLVVRTLYETDMTEVVKSAWKQCGVYPLNPAAVLGSGKISRPNAAVGLHAGLGSGLRRSLHVICDQIDVEKHQAPSRGMSRAQLDKFSKNQLIDLIVSLNLDIAETENAERKRKAAGREVVGYRMAAPGVMTGEILRERLVNKQALKAEADAEKLKRATDRDAKKTAKAAAVEAKRAELLEQAKARIVAKSHKDLGAVDGGLLAVVWLTAKNSPKIQEGAERENGQELPLPPEFAGRMGALHGVLWVRALGLRGIDANASKRQKGVPLPVVHGQGQRPAGWSASDCRRNPSSCGEA
jgi:hypothetical protein